MAANPTNQPQRAHTCEDRPDGQTLYEYRHHSPEYHAWEQDWRAETEHARVVTLDSCYDRDSHRLALLQTVTFRGMHHGDSPHVTSYRHEITLQTFNAGDAPTTVSLTWSAACALVAAIQQWECDHPDRDRDPDPPTE
jgi:hypothetical protein